MELLYIWIKNYESIKQQGFNFGGKYLFKIKSNESKEGYILSVKTNPNYIERFFDNEDIIKNITAIVGENGAGKTTLLKAIYNSNGIDVITAYLQEGQVFIIHNMKNIHFDKSIDKIIKRTSKSQQIEKISCIYLTNSMYTYDIEDLKNYIYINEFQLSPLSINTLATKFYNEILPQSEMVYTRLYTGIDEYVNDEGFSTNVGFNFFQNIILERLLNTNAFQEICDLEYYYYLIYSKVKNNYIFKENIRITIKSVIDIYTEYKNKFMKKENEGISESGTISKEAEKILDNAFSIWQNITSRSTFKTLRNNSIDIETILAYNLIFELILANNLDESMNEEELGDDYSDIIELLLKKIINKKEWYNYYTNAYKEFNEFKSMINDFKFEKHFSSDFSTDPSIVFSFSQGKDKKGQNEYLNFLKYVNNCVLSNKSFILKYIKLENIHLSSGQRAMQNFYSWLNLLRWSNEIFSSLFYRLKENIILLIDEIDLYSHPEWQRVFIRNLIEDISRQLCNKKIQIIFTTHSPLVLSDIPCNNTIYMKKSISGCVNDDSDKAKHKETFASELYTLLNDSFYLKNGIIGEFARHKIKHIIDSLILDNKDEKAAETKAVLSDEQLNDFERTISIIGDRILQENLYEMIDNYRIRNSKDQVAEELKMLEQKKSTLEERIKKLKGNIK